MSIGKKHGLEEGDNKDSPVPKKAKTAPVDGGSVDAEALKAEKKLRKKEKKEKKERKEREKKEKKEKKRKEKADRPAEDATNSTEETTDSLPKKTKKSKKTKERPSDAVEDETQMNGTTKADRTESADSIDAVKKSLKYTQSASLDSVPETEIEDFLKAKEISIFDPISSNAAPRPILSFSHLPQSKLLSKNPFATFTTPTPIQTASWPYALAGRDVIGVAETGSGKTLAFSLPCVESLASSPRPKSANKDKYTTFARAVIVSPTRELAMQTHATISDLAALVGQSAVCLYGGSSKDDQRMLLRKNNGADIIVATPGRLKDFLNEGAVSLASAAFVVLDEADRMLDKGFEDDVKLILSGCPAREKRQTLMFTATWPNSVRNLAESFMVSPVKVTIGGKTKAGDVDADGNGDGTVELQANSRIEQKVEIVDPRDKEQRLYQLLRDAQQGKARNDRILVFCLYKKEAVRVEQFLQRKGLSVASIHGDLRQDQRTRSLEAFKAGTTTVLVATDVAARGLDIPEVKLVINVTVCTKDPALSPDASKSQMLTQARKFPLTIEDYVHRIGRTGRAGKVGKAVTLFTDHDKSHSGS